MKNKISCETERNLYHVIGILSILAKLEPNGEREELVRVIENCAYAAEGAALILEKAACEITELCYGEG